MFDIPYLTIFIYYKLNERNKNIYRADMIFFWQKDLKITDFDKANPSFLFSVKNTDSLHSN